MRIPPSTRAARPRRYDQSAFARAVDGGRHHLPAALAVIDQSRRTSTSRMTGSTLTDAATGFATALSHGTNAASAFSSALSRIGDKLIGGVLDSLVGSAFKSGGLLSLFGFADGGMITGPGGPREDRVARPSVARRVRRECRRNVPALRPDPRINTGRLAATAQGGSFHSPTPEVGEEGAYDVRIAAMTAIAIITAPDRMWIASDGAAYTEPDGILRHIAPKVVLCPDGTA